MIEATLFIYGLGNQVNWGDRKFFQLPYPGDLVAVKGFDGVVHYATVRHTEHTAVPIASDGERPSAIVVTDWKSSYADHDDEEIAQ
mgnify:CR=1 FL=1